MYNNIQQVMVPQYYLITKEVSVIEEIGDFSWLLQHQRKRNLALVTDRKIKMVTTEHKWLALMWSLRFTMTTVSPDIRFVSRSYCDSLHSLSVFICGIPDVLSSKKASIKCVSMLLMTVVSTIKVVSILTDFLTSQDHFTHFENQIGEKMCAPGEKPPDHCEELGWSQIELLAGHEQKAVL